MQFLASLFVQKPLHILAVAAAFAGIYLILRFTGLGEGMQPAALLILSIWFTTRAWR